MAVRVAEPAPAPAASLSDEDANLQSILAQEYRLRDRNSMLSIPGVNFRKAMDVVSGVMTAQAEAALQAKRVQPRPSSTSKKVHSRTDKQCAHTCKSCYPCARGHAFRA